MELFLIGLGIFLVAVIIIELIIYAVKNMRSAVRAKIRKRLRDYAYIERDKDGTEIIKKRIYSEIPFFNRLLSSTPGVKALDNLMIQANAKYPMGVYIMVALLLAALGFLICSVLTRNQPLSLSLMVVCGCLPFVYLVRLKQRRIEKFKRQFPDGLDLIARALKAGHAFTGGMSMAATEFDDPLGPEFDETLDEINFGISVSDALKNMVGRIDCEEIRYFVVGVILQRETGGNLAELIETLASLIRERFKFEGKVKTLTAEGRISAIVLLALPIFLFGFLWINNPNFLKPLFTDPVGKIMFLGAIVMMIVGAIVMKNMVKVKV
jgi:tight adherence protein B